MRDAINLHFPFLMKFSNNNSLIIKYFKYHPIYKLTPGWIWRSMLNFGSVSTKLKRCGEVRPLARQKDSAVLSGGD